MIDSGIFTHPIFIAAVVLELVLKGIALWRAGRNNQPGWFVALYILNTAGILPIVYLLFFQQNKKKPLYY